jgi:hypothetical protein
MSMAQSEERTHDVVGHGGRRRMDPKSSKWTKALHAHGEVKERRWMLVVGLMMEVEDGIKDH